MKILLVDHNPMTRLQVTRFLSVWGHQVVLADDGIQALDVLQRDDPPRVALLDSTMSGVTAQEFCRRLRERRDSTPCYVLLVAMATPDCDPGALFDLGADDYVMRPLDPGTLHARLRIALRATELQERCRALETARPGMERDLSTGIWSRSAQLEFLRTQFARSTRDGISLAVLLADIDNLETIETSFGPAALETVVQEAATRIANSLRPYDFIGRYSREEFLVIAPDCTISSAFSLAERLRLLIAEKPFDIGDKEVQVTASFGIATTADTGALDDDGLLRSADSALYAAKERGRNRVEMAKRIPRQRHANPRFSPQPKGRELVQ